MYDVDLPLIIDRSSDTPLREQIVAQLKNLIGQGLIRPGLPLPSSRALSSTLRVSRSTVVDCYLELEGEGWVYSIHGAGTFVAKRIFANGDDSERTRPEKHDISRRGLLDLRPGDLDPSVMSMTGWNSAWRGILPSSAPPPAPGNFDLRDRLAAYLGSARGLRCTASEIVLCAGTAEAMAILSLAYRWSGTTVALEDPGYPAIRAILETMSVRWLPVDTSTSEVLLDNIRQLNPVPAALYLTPSHQFPLGTRMGIRARREILKWSKETGCILIEDDYDSEFRFGVDPLSSLAGLNQNSNTIYLGTMSKVLDPGLRMAYMRIPEHLLEPVMRVRNAFGSTTPMPAQQAISELLRSGEFARHIARVRRIYSDRRDALLQALWRVPAIESVRGIEAGLHVVADLKSGIRASAVMSKARELGVLVASLDEYRMTADPESPALVLGYARLAPDEIRRAVSLLSKIDDLDR